MVEPTAVPRRAHPTPAQSAAKTPATIRDQAACALVEGFAAFLWFGWAQQGPPAGWPAFLIAGAVLGLLVAVAALLLTRRHHGGPSVMRHKVNRRRYGQIVGIEFALIGIGSAALGISGRSDFIAAWILFVVGVHFLPLARLFRSPSLALAGVIAAVVAVAAAVVGITTDVLPSAIAGGVGGLVLLVSGAVTLYRGWRRSTTSQESAI